jgi:hypothetical protein
MVTKDYAKLSLQELNILHEKLKQRQKLFVGLAVLSTLATLVGVYLHKLGPINSLSIIGALFLMGHNGNKIKQVAEAIEKAEQEK